MTAGTQTFVKEYKDKRYHSKINGSRFVFSDGTEVAFNYGYLNINEKAFPDTFKGGKDHPNVVNTGRPRWHVYQDELDDILGVNPIIFTAESLQQLVAGDVKVLQNAATEAEVAAGELALSGKGTVKVAQEMGATGTGTDGQPTGVDATTLVDSALAKAQFAAGKVGPGADVAARVTAARAAQSAASVSTGGK